MADKKEAQPVRAAHSHYHKPIPPNAAYVDVYRVLQMFAVSDPCLQHAIKKLLVAGGRGAGKSIGKDIREAIDSLVRWQEMRLEESEPVLHVHELTGPAAARKLADELCRGAR